MNILAKLCFILILVKFSKGSLINKETLKIEDYWENWLKRIPNLNDCKNEGYFAHPKICGNFFRCIWLNSTSSFAKFEYNCSPGTLFDVKLKKCEHGQKAVTFANCEYNSNHYFHGTVTHPWESSTPAGIETSDSCIYDLRMHYLYGSPDGVLKRIIGFNGQFPGPVLRCTRGKWMIVRVTNSLEDDDEPTTIHWHGIEQNLSPFFDGPQSITQCPIIRATSFIYKFQLFQAGTYWYHSHHTYQYVDGAWGFLVVRNNPAEVWGPSYTEEAVISINDWHHATARSLSETFLNGGPFPSVDSSLINGRGFFSCSNVEAGQECDPSLQVPAVIKAKRGATYRLRILNSSGQATYNFSIDSHKMTVIETDGVDTIKCGPVDVITIWAAQRYSVLVTMDQPLDSYWIRISGAGLFTNQESSIGRAILKYTSASSEENFGAIDATTDGLLQISEVLENLDVEDGSDPNASQGRPIHHEIPTEFNTQSNTESIFSGPIPFLDDVEEFVAQVGSDARAFQGRPEDQHIPWQDIIAQGGIQVPSQSELAKYFVKPIPSSASIQKIIEQHFVKDFKECNCIPPISEPVDPTVAILLNDQDCPPFGGTGAPSTYDQLVMINVTDCDEGEIPKICMNGRPFEVQERSVLPVLFEVIQTQVASDWSNPLYLPEINKVVRVIINNHHVGGPHPWHLHGHTFWVLGAGQRDEGEFDETQHQLDLFGVRRDTAFNFQNSWLVFTFITDNPGTWFLHCHVNWHLEVGLGMTFVEAAVISQQVYQEAPLQAVLTCRRVGVDIFFSKSIR